MVKVEFGMNRVVKRIHITIGLVVLIVMSVYFAEAQPAAPFSKGVNLTNWFQASSPRDINFRQFTREDLERIQSLGCDVIRLPINLHAMTNGEQDYELDPLFLQFLDSVVDWSEELGLHLVIDNHTFDPAVSTPTSIEPILMKVWTQLAEHYEHRSDRLYYEVLNEPHGIGDADWGQIQGNVIDAIRSVDTKHTIIVGAANWNSYHNLKELPAYTDDNLIYTFHFYDPFIFTHQGASWTDPSMVSLSGVPFPYNAAAMPATPVALRGTWIESAMNNYHNEGNASHIKSLIDIAANFASTRNVPVFCGEFGVYIPNSSNPQRVNWYELVRQYLEEKKIAWTTWDYTGGFGLFNKGSNEQFDHDLNTALLDALGMTVPPQTPFVKKPVRETFVVYDDFLGVNILNGSYQQNGTRDFYHTTSPHEGEYCIAWADAEQYANIGFDFKQDPDLSLLPEHDFKLRFSVRTSSSQIKFDIRFIDTDKGTNDHPWRMGKTIEGLQDENWHVIEIPLNELEEKGAWENEWFDPQGKFEWSSVDRLEFVTEHGSLAGQQLWFDNVMIVGDEIPEPEEPEEPVTGIEDAFERLRISIAPNPVTDQLFIHNDEASPVILDIIVRSSIGAVMQAANSLPVEKLAMVNVEDLPAGIYILQLTDQRSAYSRTVRIVKK